MLSRQFIFDFVFFILILFGFLALCGAENVKKSADENREDNGEPNDELKEESMDIPLDADTNNITCTRRLNNQMHEILTAKSKQFPFMAALLSQQNEYICSGAVISNGLILTTAQCTDQPIRYVLLNATKAKKDDTTVYLHIIKREKFPTHIGGDTSKDVALVFTEKHNNSIASKIRLSNYTSFKNIVDFEALGFGLNSNVGQMKELQYIGLENRVIDGSNEIITGLFDCIDTKVLTCFKDTGGPIIYENELIGIITKGQDICSEVLTSKYALNKYMVEALPSYIFRSWLDEKIKKNEEQDSLPLSNYPVKPVMSRPHHRMTNSAQQSIIAEIAIFFLCSILTIF